MDGEQAAHVVFWQQLPASCVAFGQHWGELVPPGRRYPIGRNSI